MWLKRQVLRKNGGPTPPRAPPPSAGAAAASATPARNSARTTFPCTLLVPSSQAPESFERQLGDRVTKRLKSLARAPPRDPLRAGGARWDETSQQRFAGSQRSGSSCSTVPGGR